MSKLYHSIFLANDLLFKLTLKAFISGYLYRLQQPRLKPPRKAPSAGLNDATLLNVTSLRLMPALLSALRRGGVELKVTCVRTCAERPPAVKSCSVGHFRSTLEILNTLHFGSIENSAGILVGVIILVLSNTYFDIIIIIIVIINYLTVSLWGITYNSAKSFLQLSLSALEQVICKSVCSISCCTSTLIRPDGVAE